MKKISFASMMLAVLLGSCSNESIPGVGQEAESNDLVPVSLGLNMGQADVSVTRGTGTVGGTTDTDNVWNYENLYVLMTTSDKDALEDQTAEWGFTSVKGQILKEQFDNSFFARPKSVDRDGSTVWTLDYQCDPNEGGNLKYYPTKGVSDFFAYHVDDAATSVDANGNPEIKIANNAITVDFAMNGSQDLLVGKADASVTAGKNGDEKTLGFSAKTARANIIPNLKMKHLLSRLTFTLKNGNSKTNGVKIDSISVKSMYKGKMYVAYKEAPADTITWEVEDSAELFLMEKQTVGDPGYFENSLANGKCALKKLGQIEMNGVDDVEVGDALFISPGGTKYELKLYVRYAIDGGVEEKKTINVNFLHPDRNSKFEAGKSYHLNVTVYGLESIVVDTQIEKWIEEDEDINVDSDGFQTHPDGKEDLH